MTTRRITDAKVNVPPRRQDWRIGGIVALALVVRVAIAASGWAFAPGGPLVREPDSPSYVRAAESLVQTGTFGPPGKPELIRTPAYPLLVSVGVWLGQIDAATIALQIVLGCLTTWLIYRIGLLVFDRAAWALAGALAYACEPLSALYCSKLLSETLFTTAIVLALLFALRFLQRQTYWELCGTAALAALAAFVRPIAYFLPWAVAGLCVLWLWKPSESRSRLLGKGLLFLSLSFGPLLLWQARNYAVAGYPRFSAISDVNLYFYQAAAALAADRGAPIDEVQRELGYGDEVAYLRLHPEQRSWSQVERWQFQHDEATRIIREHSGAMVRAHLAGVYGMLADPGTNAYLDFYRVRDREPAPPPPRPREESIGARLVRAFREKPLAAAMHVSLCVVLFGYYAAAVLGAIVCRAWSNRELLFALAVGGYLLVLSGGPAAYHRFRLPLTPFVCLLTGCGLAALGELCCRWNKRNPPRGQGGQVAG